MLSSVSTVSEILNLIFEEVERQEEGDDKGFKGWGIQHHPLGFSEKKFKAIADLQRATTDQHALDGNLTWADIFAEEFYEALAEEDVDKAKVELVQVAAVAVSILRDIEDGGAR